jgi:hypothetical protein
LKTKTLCEGLARSGLPLLNRRTAVEGWPLHWQLDRSDGLENNGLVLNVLSGSG